jgi:hypothetical protein
LHSYTRSAIMFPRFLYKLCKTRLFPASWTILVIVLLCLPGSAIPNQGPIFSLPNLDKAVHICLFGGIVLFWGLYFRQQSGAARQQSLWLIFTAFISIALGIGLEFIQLNFIPNRSFDLWDIAADTTGSLLFLGILFIKPKPGK